MNSLFIPETEPLKLRPYQDRALNLLRRAMGRGARRLMLYSPTGSGKTEMAFQMILGALAKGKKVAFIANRKELVWQASRRLHKAGIHHGILQAENTCNTDAQVVVCSIDTIHRRGLPDGIGLFIIDEAHAVAGNKKYRHLLAKRNRIPVVGLSATPFSPGLGAHCQTIGGTLFEEMVQAATIRELIDLGFLVDCDVYAPDEPDLTGIRTQRGVGGEVDYAETELAQEMNKPALTGGIAAHWLKLAAGKQTVAFAVNIAHSLAIVAEFQAAGIAAAHLDYRHTDEERTAMLDAFAQGEITVLSNAGLLAEGWDCPSAECMILARPTKSMVRYVQMVGRVLRPHAGKKMALLLDHSGSVRHLGFATDDLPLELDDGKPNKAGQRQERKKSEPTICPACNYVRPAGVHVCPDCGFAPVRQSTVKTGEGELVKLDRNKPATKDTKQHVFSQILFIAQKRGRKSGWVANQYRSIFGVWPRGMNEVTATPTQEVLNKVKANAIAFAKRRNEEASHEPA